MATENKKLQQWVEDMVALCQPDNVVWCDGSKDEWSRMWDILVKGGTAKKLDEKKRPNSYYIRSVPADVARVEDRTYICSETEEEFCPSAFVTTILFFVADGMSMLLTPTPARAIIFKLEVFSITLFV